MKEKDLITIKSKINHDPEDYEKEYAYKEEDRDEAFYDYLFWEIFTGQRDFLKKLSYYLDKYKGKNYKDDEIYKMTLYYIKYKQDLIGIHSNIEDCISDIDSQISDIEDEIEACKIEKNVANDKFDEIVDEICNIINARTIPISVTSPRKHVKDSFGINTSEVEDQIYDLDGWKNEYWENDEKISDYEDLLNIAGSNKQTAEYHLKQVQEVMYD